MKRIILDNCFINRLIGSDNNTNDVFSYLIEKVKTSQIEVYAIPTNIIEIALCSDHDKRNALANVLNKLIKGKNILLSWDSYLVLFLFEEINKQITGVLKDKSVLLHESKNYTKLMLGLLGQLCCFKDYEFEIYQYIVREKLITKYYQARFVSDPEFYLSLYKKQLEGTLLDTDIEDDSQFDSMSIMDLENMISEKLIDRKSIRNIKKFSEMKNDMVLFFSKYELKNLLINFFRYKEIIENSLDLKVIVNNWGSPLFGRTAKPLAEEFTRIASDATQIPTKKFYQHVLLKLAERLPDGCYFPIDHIYNIYLNELEKIINRTKSLSKGSALDLDYYPACLMSDHFITDDRDLYENIGRMLEKIGRDAAKVLSYSRDWKKYV